MMITSSSLNTWSSSLLMKLSGNDNEQHEDYDTIVSIYEELENNSNYWAQAKVKRLLAKRAYRSADNMAWFIKYEYNFKYGKSNTITQSNIKLVKDEEDGEWHS